jgi:hypothetical protein
VPPFCADGGKRAAVIAVQLVDSITLDHQQRATLAVLVILPSTRPGRRAIRSKLPAQLLEHAEQRNAFHLDAGTSGSLGP